MRRCAPTGCGVLQSASAFLTSALLRTRRAEGRPEHEASRSTSASAAAALSPAALTDYAAALQRWCKKRVGAGTCPCLNPAAVFLLGIFGEEAVLLHRCPRPSSCPRLSDWRHEYIIGDCGARTPSCPTHPPTGAWPPPPKGQMPFQTWCTTVRTSPLCFAERTLCPSAACHTLPHTVAPSRALGRNETRCGFLPHLAHCSTLIVHVCTVT